MNDRAGSKRTLALGTPENRPAWLRVTDGEREWWVALAILVAVALHFTMPSQFVVHPAYIVPGIELALLIVMAIMHPATTAHRSPRLRVVAQIQFAIIAVWNIASLALLVRAVTNGSKITADALLLGGVAIWLTNVIVFSLWYWEWDRGGPAARAAGTKDIPDLLFPQMTDEHLAMDWEPFYLDYFFVSFTNSTAFSPTDTMPLSRWMKVLFIIQSGTALITIALVAARAVNILPSA